MKNPQMIVRVFLLCSHCHSLLSLASVNCVSKPHFLIPVSSMSWFLLLLFCLFLDYPLACDLCPVVIVWIDYLCV